jgi:hypothetical protein
MQDLSRDVRQRYSSHSERHTFKFEKVISTNDTSICNYYITTVMGRIFDSRVEQSNLVVPVSDIAFDKLRCTQSIIVQSKYPAEAVGKTIPFEL